MNARKFGRHAVPPLALLILRYRRKVSFPFPPPSFLVAGDGPSSPGARPLAQSDAFHRGSERCP